MTCLPTLVSGISLKEKYPASCRYVPGYEYWIYSCLFLTSRSSSSTPATRIQTIITYATHIQLLLPYAIFLYQFGCFVQLEGLRKRHEGLVHVSHLRREGRVSDVSEVVSKGQRVKIKVLSITGTRMSLSIKDVNQETGEDLNPKKLLEGGDGDDDERNPDRPNVRYAVNRDRLKTAALVVGMWFIGPIVVKLHLIS